jgi:hypothetical protein
MSREGLDGVLWCVEAREKVARGQYRLMGG